MPKGYVIGRITVTDPEQYAIYAKLATEAIRKYGGRPLVRGGRWEALEGDARPRNVVLEFADYDSAKQYYYSAEYQAAKQERLRAGVAELVLVEGPE